MNGLFDAIAIAKYVVDMTKKGYLTLIIIFALCLALSGATQKKNQNHIPTVSLCDLTEHYEKYVGKVVRINASYVSWWESSYIYDLKCEDAAHKIHDAIDCSDEQSCQKLGKEIYGFINQYQRPDKNNHARRAFVTLVGKLEGPSENGYGHLGSFRFEFRIKKAEKASPMPSHFPYKN